MPENAHSESAVLNALRVAAGRFILKHLWKILVGLAGFFSGGALTYLSIWRAVDHAVAAAEKAETNTEQLGRKIDSLVTAKELQDAKDRITTLEDRMDYAKAQAGTAPGRGRRR